MLFIIKPGADKTVVVLLVWRPTSSLLITWYYLIYHRCCRDFWSLAVIWCWFWLWLKKHFILSAIFLQSHVASVELWISCILYGSQRSCRSSNFDSLSLSHHSMLSFCLDMTTACWFWSTLYSSPQIFEMGNSYSRPLVFPFLTPSLSLERYPRWDSKDAHIWTLTSLLVLLFDLSNRFRAFFFFLFTLPASQWLCLYFMLLFCRLFGSLFFYINSTEMDAGKHDLYIRKIDIFFQIDIFFTINT